MILGMAIAASAPRIKTTIIMQQYQAFHDAEGGDDDINGFADGNAGFSKGAVILSAFNGNIISPD